MYYRTRAAPRFRAVRGGTSRVRKSYAYDPVRCKTLRDAKPQEEDRENVSVL